LDKPLNRLFSWRQRKLLQIVAGNMCQNCGEALSGSFHADHVQAYSKGGWTVTKNGQALCAPCNLKKGAK